MSKLTDLESKPIIDVACGSKMFWFNKSNPNVAFTDRRSETINLPDRTVEISPDMVADFRHLPFSSNHFYMVVFDPPHLLRAGKNSWLAQKYGTLNPDTWKQDLHDGFTECMRILRPYGTLIFKWNTEQIPMADVLATLDFKPLFGDKRAKTRWLVFMKVEEVDKHDMH